MTPLSSAGASKATPGDASQFGDIVLRLGQSLGQGGITRTIPSKAHGTPELHSRC